MIISIASGKGGTGKTTIAVNLARAAEEQDNLQFIDADVEEPNAHLFLKPVIDNKEAATIPVPQIDEDKCNYCGTCAQICAFNALAVTPQAVLTFYELCHGCGGCAYLCPEKAIQEVPREIGFTEKGTAGNISFVHGRLNTGEAMSPPLIEAAKEKAESDKMVLIDAPPGTSCPVVAAVRETNYCLLVTEPTPFGLHDLQLVVELLKKLNIPCGVIINRADMGDDQVESYCIQQNIPILMHIPWDRNLAYYCGRGEAIVDHSPEWKKKFIHLWEEIKLKLNHHQAKAGDAG